MIIKTNLLNKFNLLGFAFFPFVFVTKDTTQETINHELIHIEQQKELLIIGFYLLYVYFHFRYGYDKNPFEVEAYNNETDLTYLSKRKRYSIFINKN